MRPTTRLVNEALELLASGIPADASFTTAVLAGAYPTAVVRTARQIYDVLCAKARR